MRTVRSALLSVVLSATLAGPQPVTAATPALADLVMAPVTDLTLDTSARPGRRLLRFTTKIANVGTGAFEVKGQRATTTDATMSVEQHVFDTDGSHTVNTTPAKMLFDVGDGHQHWHIDKLERYELFTLPDLRKQPQEGAKIGYCFYDGSRYDLTLPGAPQSPVYSTCGGPTDLAVTTGLSVGWADIYPYNIANQWIDVTDVPDGSYRVQVTADPFGWFQEANEGNNANSIDFTLQTSNLESRYGSAVTVDAPVSHWRLGEGVGQVANDRQDRNVGTYANGPTLGVTGLLIGDADTAVGFDGANDQVRVSNSASLSPSSRVSVEAWFRAGALPAVGNFASILSKPESYSLQFDGPRLEFTIIQSGTRLRLQAPAGAVVTGQTYHVVGTYDGATQRLYVNGSQVTSAPLTGAISVTPNDLMLGSWDGVSEFLNGVIDEAAVYDTVLSSARVRAHYDAGIGAAAGGPAAPSSLTAAAVSPNRIDTTWTDNSGDETGFVLERSPDSSFATVTAFPPFAANTVSYSDTAVAPATTYYYRVKATNANGSSGYSNVASATTPSATVTAPAAPTNLMAVSPKGGKDRIAVSWTDRSTNESNFVLERSRNGFVSADATFTLAANATSYTDRSVVLGASYSYRIKAVNAAGSSGYSNVASATVR